MLVIVPGVVVGKYSIKDDPEFVRALAPTHVATFAESLLSAASLTSLQEGKTELTSASFTHTPSSFSLSAS